MHQTVNGGTIRFWKPAIVAVFLCLLIAGAWQFRPAQRPSTIGGDIYTVEFVWNRGSATAMLADRPGNLHIDSRLHDLILEEAEKVVADRVTKMDLPTADGYVELTVVGPSPAFVQVYKFEVTRPDISQIMAAVEREDGANLQKLVSLSGNVNLKQPPAGRTPLYTAAAGMHANSVRVLIQLGADPNIPDVDGDTALSVASRTGDARIIKMLVDAGARVNSQNLAGLTPLMLAARSGNLEAVRALLTAGADPNVRTPTGETALTLARKSRQERVAPLLQGAGR